MTLSSYATIYNKAVLELDLQNEPFVGTNEILGYINEAISDAQTCIHTLGAEDTYFLVNSTINLVNGTAAYALPTDIYANKIRKVYYINGALVYEVFKIRQLNQTLFFQPGDSYQFLLINNQVQSGGIQINFYPTPLETGAFIQLWYIREMRTLTNSTTDPNNVCEVPEVVNFIHQHVRYNLAKKTRRTDLVDREKVFLDEQYDLMAQTLKEMIPDENNKVIPDWSSYWGQEVDYFYP